MSTTSTSAGWYQDPHSSGKVRYFDGQRWTEHTAVTPTSLADPSPTVVPFASSFGEEPSDPVHWMLPVGRSWQSLVAGYLGLFALVIWPLGPVSLGMGVWALMASSRTGTHGRGRAWFAVVVGTLTTLLLIYIVGMSISWDGP